MAAITISRQLGSLGFDIARMVADHLGYRLVWRELINQAALRAGTPDVALATIDELGLLDVCPSPKACRVYCEAVKQVVEELASEGNVVIVGRAGQVLLHNHPEVLHIRLVAPVEVRAQRTALKQQISLDSARAQVVASDHYRSRYLKRFYRIRWDDPDYYHLIINTERITCEVATLLIEHALANQIRHQTPSPT